MPLPQALLVPSGDNESLGIGKETAGFGVYASPTVYHAFTDFAPKPKNEILPRIGARKRYGQSRPVTAGYVGDATLEVETDSDTLPQLLAYSLGSQTPFYADVSTDTGASPIVGSSTPQTVTFTSGTHITVGTPLYIGSGSNLEAVYPTVVSGAMITGVFLNNHIANSPVTSAANRPVSTDIGGTPLTGGGSLVTITPTSMTDIVLNRPLFIGTSSDANREMVIPQNITGTTFDAYVMYPHLANAVLTSPNVALLKFGLLPSMSISLDRIIDGVRYLGCMVESLAIGMTPKAGLSCKFGLVYQTENVVAAGSSPSYSTKNPYIFEHPFNMPTFNGTAIGSFGEVSVLSWTMNLANNLMKNYYSFGRGRSVANFPQLQRKVTGTVTLGFETNAAYLAFLGASTSPARITVPAVALQFLCASQDDPNFMLVQAPNCTLTQHEVNNKSNAVLQQVFQFESSESTNGANDDISILLGGAVGPF